LASYFHNQLQLISEAIARAYAATRMEFSTALGLAMIVVWVPPFFIVGFARVKGAFANSALRKFTYKSGLSDEEIKKINKYDLVAFEGVWQILLSMAALVTGIGLYNSVYWLAVIFGTAFVLLFFGGGPYIGKCVKNGSRFRNFKTIDPNKYKE